VEATILMNAHESLEQFQHNPFLVKQKLGLLSEEMIAQSSQNESKNSHDKKRVGTSTGSGMTLENSKNDSESNRRSMSDRAPQSRKFQKTVKAENAFKMCRNMMSQVEKNREYLRGKEQAKIRRLESMEQKIAALGKKKAEERATEEEKKRKAEEELLKRADEQLKKNIELAKKLKDEDEIRKTAEKNVQKKTRKGKKAESTDQFIEDSSGDERAGRKRNSSSSSSSSDDSSADENFNEKDAVKNRVSDSDSSSSSDSDNDAKPNQKKEKGKKRKRKQKAKRNTSAKKKKD